MPPKPPSPSFSRRLRCIPIRSAFLDEVVNYLVKNGVMEPKTMFETPFTNINDQGVVGVFGEKESKKIVETIQQINRNADVA